MYGIIFNRGCGSLTALLLLAFGFRVGAATPTPLAFERTVLTQSVAPVVSGAAPLSVADLGRRIDFMVSLKMRNYAEMLARVGNGEIISPDEMLEKYYPAEADYKTVLDWLGEQGFTITKTDPNHLGIFVSGTVGQIQQALQVSFGQQLRANKNYLSAVTPPSVPKFIEPLIIGINGLQPDIQAHRSAERVPVQSWRFASRPIPLSSQIRNQPPYLVSEILKAYDANTLTVTGVGQKIAIVIDTFPNDSDLTSFWSLNNLSQNLNRIEKVQAGNGTLPSVSGEETLDAEWSSGIANAAGIRIYATTDFSFVNIDRAFQAILNDIPNEPELHQVSFTLVLGEGLVSRSQVQTDSQYFASMTAQGLSVFVSSGDHGSEEGGTTQVNYYASDPSVTAVGGTSLTLTSTSGFPSSETAWAGSGGGVSNFVGRPFWQTGPGVPDGATRLVPDVASAADPFEGALVVLNGQQFQFGGTSWSAPVWAGFCALINQARANALLPPAGLLGPKLYPLLRTTAYRDIVLGSNGAYQAGLGYDLCTGLGVPDLKVLLRPLTGGPSPPPARTPPKFGQLVDPPPGSTLTSSAVTFSWTAGEATAYQLLIGSFLGGQDIFNSGRITNLSATVTTIPTDGRIIFVRLISFVPGVPPGGAPPQDYAYTALTLVPAAPVIIPNGGVFRKRKNVRVQIADITSGAIIHYTTNRRIPTAASPVYTSPLRLRKSAVVRAIAIKPGVASTSPIASARFTIRRR
jgi:kumamolisin